MEQQSCTNLSEISKSKEHGHPKPENGDRETENRNWKLENGYWKLKTGPRRPVSGGRPATTRSFVCPNTGYPEGPLGPKYIRSGPEGARGVLNVRGWSLCMFLSELLSFRLPSSGCLSVGLFVPLTGARGSPGLPRDSGRSF